MSHTGLGSARCSAASTIVRPEPDSGRNAGARIVAETATRAKQKNAATAALRGVRIPDVAATAMTVTSPRGVPRRDVRSARNAKERAHEQEGRRELSYQASALPHSYMPSGAAIGAAQRNPRSDDVEERNRSRGRATGAMRQGQGPIEPHFVVMSALRTRFAPPPPCRGTGAPVGMFLITGRGGSGVVPSSLDAADAIGPWMFVAVADEGHGGRRMRPRAIPWQICVVHKVGRRGSRVSR